MSGQATQPGKNPDYLLALTNTRKNNLLAMLYTPYGRSSIPLYAVLQRYFYLGMEKHISREGRRGHVFKEREPLLTYMGKGVRAVEKNIH